MISLRNWICFVMTVYVDADHAHGLVAKGPSQVYNMSIRWASNCQKTVETASYVSELVASRIATELTVEVRFMLRLLCVALDGPSLML
jgi:predicted carbohydrate-binding protein with CBM5 and CBM33 domain